MNNTYKICLIGDAGVGKTTWAARLATGRLVQDYVPTWGMQLYPVNVETNYGPRMLHIWDTAGDKEHEGVGEGNYIRAFGAIAMYDLTCPETLEHLKDWVASFAKVRPGAPIFVVGTHADCPQEVRCEDICTVLNAMVDEHDMEFNEMNISILNGENWKDPALEILRLIEREPTLQWKD